ALGLVLSLGLFGRRGWIATLIVAVSIPLTWTGLLFLQTLGGRPPSPSAALGYACYTGYPTSLRVYEVALLVLVPALVALVFLGTWRLRSGPALGPPEEPVAPTPLWRRRLGWL